MSFPSHTLLLDKLNQHSSWNKTSVPFTDNSNGPFVLPCTVSTQPLGQNTESCVPSFQISMTWNPSLQISPTWTLLNKPDVFTLPIKKAPPVPFSQNPAIQLVEVETILFFIKHELKIWLMVHKITSNLFLVLSQSYQSFCIILFQHRYICNMSLC